MHRNLSLTIPRHHPYMVFVVFGVFMLTLLWLGVEDTTLLPPVLLAVGLTLSVGVRVLAYQRGGQHYSRGKALMDGLLLGALGGLITTMLTIVLMFLKTAMHSHAYPDYPPQVMFAVLMRAPAWSAAGALIALGGVLLWIAATVSPPEQ